MKIRLGTMRGIVRYLAHYGIFHYGVIFYLSVAPLAAQSAPVPQSTSQSDSASSAGGGSLLDTSKLADGDFGKLPTYVKSDSLILKSAERTFVYSGNVEVRQGDMILTSTTLEGKYAENNQIEQLLAQTNVIVTKGEAIRATGEKAIYDAATATVTLTENPELQQEGSILTADVIKIFLNENRSSAEGSVRVKLVKKEGQSGATEFLKGAGKK